MNFILISDAVKLTGLDRQTIRNWIDKGIIHAQKINGTFYVDKDTFMALSEKMKDVDGAIKNLDALKEKYVREAEEYKMLRETIRIEHNISRYLSICVNSGIRTHFFENIVISMKNSRLLSEKEAYVLLNALMGKDLDDIAKDCNTSRERIRQIGERAIRRSRELVVTDTKAKDEEIKNLKDEVAVLKRMVYKNAIYVSEDGLSEAEKRLARMDRLELIKLLSRPLEEEKFTVRTKNALTYFKHDDTHFGIKTLGDLCKVSKDRMMQQRNVGHKTIIELTDFLTDNGLTWGMDIDRILGLI